jgi:2-methylisocitrate lyase-like PEP mutase family enzyme
MSTLARTFRLLHNKSQPLILPNAWDAGSPRLFEDLGATAIATTSAGVCWSLGYPDGNVLPTCLLADLATNITRVIQVPLSVDIEGGYSDSPDEVGENVKPLLDAGVIGINIGEGEDSPDLLEAKIESVRRTSSILDIDLFINARTDVYLRSLVPERERVEETINRAARYVMAGADCLFVSGLVDTNAIEEIASEIQIPLNIATWPGLPPAADLGKLGVRRLSSGSGIPQILWKHVAELAKRFLETGDSKLMSENCMSHAQLQELFSV